LLNQRIATPRDDLFSLGCIAYELFTGRHPFGLLSSLEARRQALQPGYDERIPRDLFAPIRQLLAWEREFRQNDALEFLNALAAVEISQAPPMQNEQRSDPPTVQIELPATEELDEEAANPPTLAPIAQPRVHPGGYRSTLLPVIANGARSAYAAACQVMTSVPWHELASSAVRQLHALRWHLQWRTARVVSEPEVRGAPPRRDTVPLAAVAGVAGLAFLVLHWSNAARAPYRPTPVRTNANLAALAALPIDIVNPAITIPQPSPLSFTPAPTPPRPAPQRATPQVRPANGRVWLTAARVRVAAGQKMAVVNLRRDQSTVGAAPVSWTIAPGTAKPGVDYETPKVRVARFNDGQEIRTLFVPLKPAKPGKPERRFTIKLQKTPQGPEFGPITQTEVVIAGM
jgi:hypothetical protein